MLLPDHLLKVSEELGLNALNTADWCVSAGKIDNLPCPTVSDDLRSVNCEFGCDELTGETDNESGRIDEGPGIENGVGITVFVAPVDKIDCLEVEHFISSPVDDLTTKFRGKMEETSTVLDESLVADDKWHLGVVVKKEFLENRHTPEGFQC